MGIPFWQSAVIGRYVVAQKLRGRKRFPLILMLEPLLRCNLECVGCGKIQYPKHILDRRLSPEECWAAVEECGAPVVSVAGGEPLLHAEIDRIVEGLVARKKFVYLCTNAIQLKRKMEQFRPSRYLTFSVHVDGLEATHDKLVCREGVFKAAVEAITTAKAAGFRVTTNTTVFEGEDPAELRAMFDALTELGVDGLTISPGYSYNKAPDQAHFLRRDRTREMFAEILGDPAPRWSFNHSPLYLQFLAGMREYQCTPWGSPLRNVFGWQRPCYLLQDGYAASFRELMDETDWDRYGTGRDPRCADCMAHCGYEPSAVVDASGSLRGGVAMVASFVLGTGIKRKSPSSGGEPSGMPIAARPREVPVAIQASPVVPRQCADSSATSASSSAL